MSKNNDVVPVYLFTGFLESGKTKFIQSTLEDKRFCRGERTLLLVCEEGEEEYAPEQFADSNVFIRVVESPEELRADTLAAWYAEVKAERVLIEYNGMWMLDNLYEAMPEGWMVYQEFMFADAGSFLSYNANMRQLVYDKLKSCELVVFNRFTKGLDETEFHKIVRGVSRRCDIAYEAPDGKVRYDDIEDPLPFDLNAPIVEIQDMDFAEWYRDMSEEPQKYENKIVRVKSKTLLRKKMPAHTFIVGRHVMTCCADDIQFAGLAAQMDDLSQVKDESWAVITAQVNFKYNRAYSGKGPVLTVRNFEPCEVPEQPVATFY